MGPTANRVQANRPAAGANPALSANPRWCNRRARGALDAEVEVRVLGGEPNLISLQYRYMHLALTRRAAVV